MNGLVIKSTGSWYEVKLDANGDTICARLRGRFKTDNKKITNPIAVGDRVVLSAMKETSEWVIEKIIERENYIIRKSPRKKNHDHLIAANVDQGLLVATLKSPKTSFGFIDRFLVTLEAFRIPGAIIFNKVDLLSEEEFAEALYAKHRYEALGYSCFLSSFTEEGVPKALRAFLTGKKSIVSGHSGTGKSTFVNLLFPGLNQKVGEVSSFADKGTHTTTFAEMFFLDDTSAIIDTPGIKELGISEIEQEELGHYFPEMRAHLGQCRFHNCIHVNEPGCVIREQVETGEIQGERYLSYISILEGEDNRR